MVNYDRFINDLSQSGLTHDDINAILDSLLHEIRSTPVGTGRDSGPATHSVTDSHGGPATHSDTTVDRGDTVRQGDTMRDSSEDDEDNDLAALLEMLKKIMKGGGDIYKNQRGGYIGGGSAFEKFETRLIKFKNELIKEKKKYAIDIEKYNKGKGAALVDFLNDTWVGFTTYNLNSYTILGEISIKKRKKAEESGKLKEYQAGLLEDKEYIDEESLDKKTKFKTLPETFLGSEKLVSKFFHTQWKEVNKTFQDNSSRLVDKFIGDIQKMDFSDGSVASSGASSGASSVASGDAIPTGDVNPQQQTTGNTHVAGNSDLRTDEQKNADTNKLNATLNSNSINELTNVRTNVEIDFAKLEADINKNVGKSTFKLFEKAKHLLNSKLLLLLGAAQLQKNGFLQLTTENNKRHIPSLFDYFFIKLEGNEKEILLNTVFHTHPVSKDLFNVFMERDSKFVDGDAISVYALLYLFNLNRDKVILSEKPLKEQIITNKPIFGKTKGDGALLNDTNLPTVINLLKKCSLRLGEISGIYDIYVKNKASAEDYQKIRDAYHKVISDNKSVIALLKRRDDWNNSKGSDMSKLHYRFRLSQEGNTQVGDNSKTQPLLLSYNDTPMRLPWSSTPRTTEETTNSYSHKYKLYGFDSIYNSSGSNRAIADSFNDKYINKMKKDATKNETTELQPMCFIGYGQSGSGKTSTLIYLDVFKEDGILVEILKKLNPATVTSSMIEIYEEKSANNSDATCVGIGTDKYKQGVEGKPGFIVDPCPPKKRDRIDVPNPVDTHPNGTVPVMRKVTIGEILDKRADDMGVERKKFVPAEPEGPVEHGVRSGGGGNVMDSTTKVTFTRKDAAWLYTHDSQGTSGVDKDYDVKQYVMDAFECREIGPTSNNKQSSRSHVVVCLILEGISVNGVTMRQVIYVCDLAGVENVFDCTPGSEDSIRMMAKILANKNYHLTGTEEWGSDLIKKRPNNILKYVHRDIHIGTTQDPADDYVKDPNCWPDGSPNPKGDLDEIAQAFSREFIVKWYKGLIGNEGGFPSEEDALAFYKKKLSKLPIVPKSANTIKAGIRRFYKEAENKVPGFIGTTISKFMHNNDNNYTIHVPHTRYNSSLDKKMRANGKGQKYFYFPSLSTLSEFDSTMKNFNKDSLDKIKISLKNLRGDNDKGEVVADGILTGRNFHLGASHIMANIGDILPVIEKFLILANKIFTGLEAPDCVLAYVGGIEQACTIRRKEGYIINNTLSQLIKDLKFVMKDAIKSKLEDGGDNLPCIFGDMYDKYDEYQILDPLIDWYDVANENERNADIGTILSAMCILGLDDKVPKDIKKEDKVNFLKQFKFVMTTVINETFIMNFGNKNATTPAGNLIYVNNPPLPPYINVSIFEKAQKKYMFHKYDSRDDENEDPDDEKELRKKCVWSFFDAYFNLIIKMFTHPLYQLDAIAHLANFQQFNSSGKYDLIDFSSKDEFYQNWKKYTQNPAKAGELDKLDQVVERLLVKIKGNNSATYIGTMQTTEEVNRVSSKLMISEPVNVEARYSALNVENENANNIILKELFEIFTRERNVRGKRLQRESITSVKRKPLTDAQLYESLYAINVIDSRSDIPKRSQTLKEMDIDSILVALEAVFPRAITYVDYEKLQHLWEKTTSETRGKYVLLDNTTERKSYPYLRDIFAKKAVDDEELSEIFKPDNKKVTGVLSNTKVIDLLTLNAKIKEYGALEPSPKYITEKEIAYVNEKKASEWSQAAQGGGAYCPQVGGAATALTEKIASMIDANPAGNCPLCKKKVNGWMTNGGTTRSNKKAWKKHSSIPQHTKAQQARKERNAKKQRLAADASAAAHLAANPQIPSLEWFKENSKVKQPFMSIFKHMLRDDFIDLYKKDYLLKMVEKTGAPEVNGWANGHSEPKPSGYKTKTFPALIEKKFDEEPETWEPQAIDILNRNHEYIFLNQKDKIAKQVQYGWKATESAAAPMSGGGYKKKKSRRPKTRRQKNKNKKRKTRRKYN